MSDKDQFTFEDGDDLLKTNLDEKDEPQKPSFDDDGSSERNLADQEESQERELDNENPTQAEPDNLNEFQDLGLSYDDDFPETDLSEAFSEDEYVAGDPVSDEPEKNVKGGKPRILLMVLLLIIAVGAGAYYFMGLGGTTPSVPTVPVTVKKTTKSVALPAPAAEKVPVLPANVQPAAKPVTVAVPPPPAAEPVAKSTEEEVVEKSQRKPEAQPSTQVAVAVSQPKLVETKAASASAPDAQKTVAVSPVPASTESTKASEPAKQMAGGVFTLDAGSYLFESNRKSLVEKIKKLGYEPIVTPVDATLDMTRLRLGTFDEDDVQEALDLARSIEPGAYSAPAGDSYVIYAGTFLRSRNIEQLSQRFLEEGINVHAEPVQVVRTLSRIRFGRFATQEEATTVAQEVAKVGINAAVITSK